MTSAEAWAKLDRLLGFAWDRSTRGGSNAIDAAHTVVEDIVREALADTTAEQLQEEAMRTGTLYGTPIADLQAIWRTTRALNIPIDKLREKVEAKADPLGLLETLAKRYGVVRVRVGLTSELYVTRIGDTGDFMYEHDSQRATRAEAEALLKGGTLVEKSSGGGTNE